MKPQRFRSLRGARVQKQKLPHPALIAAAALLFFAVATLCRAEESGSKMFLIGNEQCRAKLTADDRSIYTDASGQTLKPAFDPDQACSLNKGDETVSRNATALDQVPEALRNRAAYTGDRANVKSQGACRLAYQSVKQVFDTVSNRQSQFCEAYNAAYREAQGCGGVSVACKDKWDRYREVNEKYASELQHQRNAALAYIDSFVNATQKARDRYQHDFELLRTVMRQRQQTGGAADAIGDSLPDSDVKASNGNKDSQAAESSKALETYYSMLDVPVATQTTLIKEEDSASRNLQVFRGTIKTAIDQYQDTASKVATNMASLLAQVDKDGSIGTNSTISDKLKKASELTGAADPLSKMLGEGDKSKDSSGSDSSSPGSSGGGSSHDAAPAAAMAAAAGFGAAAAHGSDSGASQAPTQSASPGQGSTGASPSVSNFGDTSSGGGGSRGHASAGAGGADAYNVSAAKTDAAAKTDETGVNPGFAGSYSPGDGASRMMAGKRAPAAGASNGTPVEAGGAGNPEGMPNAFSGNLDARPAPKPATNPGSEVANLLGQMKNLFNFDESAGMPGGGAPFGPAPGGGAAPAEPGAPGAAPAPPDAQTAEGGGAPIETTEAAAAPMTGGGHAEELLSNPYGKTDVSLFSRVRSRHQRCMERGLVLYGLKERIE